MNWRVKAQKTTQAVLLAKALTNVESDAMEITLPQFALDSGPGATSERSAATQLGAAPGPRRSSSSPCGGRGGRLAARGLRRGRPGRRRRRGGLCRRRGGWQLAGEERDSEPGADRDRDQGDPDRVGEWQPKSRVEAPFAGTGETDRGCHRIHGQP